MVRGHGLLFFWGLNMTASFEKFGFYVVDMEYMAYLNSVDKEVYYDADKAYSHKPFLGVVVNLGKYEYLIPLTSAKQKHSKWPDSSKEAILIYEVIEAGTERLNHVYKPGNTSGSSKHIMGVLDIKKMIPVPATCCRYVDISSETDLRYRYLLQKEYQFLQKRKNDILSKVEAIYNSQKISGIIHSFYCNYSALEDAYEQFLIHRLSK